MKGRDIKSGRFSDNGTVPDDPLRDRLERLAIRFADEMLGEATATLGEDEAAIFKTLSNYYAATRRLPVAKVEEDADDGFAALKERINGSARPDETETDR